MVLLEAAAIGLPVIGSRSGGIAETMCEGESGLLVPPGDPQALATTLATLMDDRTRRLAMGAGGREFVTRNFDRGRQTKRLEALYDALLQKSSTLDQSLNLF
jgi:glycosyltransferase involved in cell wall biosynthesis